MEKVQFGVAETTASLTTGSKGADVAGLMGVGFDTGEAGVARGKPLYPNIVSELQRNNVIGTKAFSLYINSQGLYIQAPPRLIVVGLTNHPPSDAATGNILFGGVDTSLYTGPLIPVPMTKQAGGHAVTDYYVSWTSFTSSSASGDSKNDLQDLSNNTLPRPSSSTPAPNHQPCHPTCTPRSNNSSARDPAPASHAVKPTTPQRFNSASVAPREPRSSPQQAPSSGPTTPPTLPKAAASRNAVS